MKAINPYEASAQPAESSGADSPSNKDKPPKANEFQLTSYGVWATAIILGLFAVRSVLGGGFPVCLYIFGLINRPGDMFHEGALWWLGRGMTRLVLGIVALAVVWHCRTLIQELRAASRGETSAKALVQPQRKCWTSLGILLFLYGIVLILGTFFYDLRL